MQHQECGGCGRTVEWDQAHGRVGISEGEPGQTGTEHRWTFRQGVAVIHQCADGSYPPDHDRQLENAAPAIPTSKPQLHRRNGPKWEAAAKDRVRSGIRRFSKPLADLIARDANEGDTRLLVTDFLCEALGYDKYENLTTEYQVKGEFADYGVRIEKQLVAFIEVKRCTTKLSDKHLRQVQSYAANEGVEWMILTNGAAWQVYHLTAGLPLQTDLALGVDLLGDQPTGEKVADLFLLTKESFGRGQINDRWLARRATSPPSIAKALLGDVMVDQLRKEIRRQTDYNPTHDELRVGLGEIISPELLG